MSRAFVNEDNDAGEPPIIPQRAALPPGVDNYVTSNGLELLKNEREALEKEKSEIPKDGDPENRRELQILNGKLDQLNNRISSAKVVDPTQLSQDKVRFGATVELENVEGENKGEKRIYQIVGVDEASIKDNKISFVAPIARVLIGKEKGDIITFHHSGQKEKLQITNISY